MTDLSSEEFHGEQGNVAIRTISVDQMTHCLRTFQPFAFSRHGDGEIQAIMAMPGGSGANLIDSYKYTPKLTLALRKTTMAPHPDPYYYGISPAAFRLNARGVAQKAIEMYAPRVNWCDGQVIAKASAEGKLHAFLQAMSNGYDIIYVGPAHVLDAVNRILTLDACIEVPLRDAPEQVVDVMMRLIMALGEGPYFHRTLIGFSAGPLANVVMHALWPSLPGVTMIDFGSMWDPYAGLMTRSYFKQVDNWDAVIRRNVHGDTA